MVATTKDPVKSDAGRRGARARWGESARVVRLDSLDPRVAAAVVALVRAAEAARSTAPPDADPIAA